MLSFIRDSLASLGPPTGEVVPGPPVDDGVIDWLLPSVIPVGNTPLVDECLPNEGAKEG